MPPSKKPPKIFSCHFAKHHSLVILHLAAKYNPFCELCKTWLRTEERGEHLWRPSACCIIDREKRHEWGHRWKCRIKTHLPSDLLYSCHFSALGRSRSVWHQHCSFFLKSRMNFYAHHTKHFPCFIDWHISHVWHKRTFKKLRKIEKGWQEIMTEIKSWQHRLTAGSVRK